MDLEQVKEFIADLFTPLQNEVRLMREELASLKETFVTKTVLEETVENLNRVLQQERESHELQVSQFSTRLDNLETEINSLKEIQPTPPPAYPTSKGSNKSRCYW